MVRAWTGGLAALGLTCAMAGHALAAITFDERELDAGTFIVVSGEIEFTDSLAPFEALARQGRARFVTFDSPGGSPYKAMDLGRLIRRYGLSTVQVRSSECASACALAFMGGAARLAMAGSIGVHRSSFSDTSSMPVEDAVSSIQQLTADIMAYMNEMGVDPSLLQLALQYGSDDIRYLSSSEMERYRVVVGLDSTIAASSASTTTPVTAPRPSTSAAPQTLSSLAIPRARSGRVQHPKGYIELKRGPDPGARSGRRLANGIPLEILSVEGDWYLVRASGSTGYAHATWIMVDQFDAALSGFRRIQIRSARTIEAARAMVATSSVSAEAFLTANGWFAIALKQTFDRKEAGEQTLKALKSRGLIPEDSMLTFANTYVRPVCCQ
ncbi:hypothetical protein LB518_10060 [Mesorhizobium sp. BR1-1-16]|uniref:SH3 domain-containing protein n=1 Tax=Mesorhizobium sp. BR1-1-16 TaxID=2876653 RepID=UPI001CCB68E7|nr:SH3 domain-containing protein [Mesorhizobium sp. BR1-1-16]MBZ9936639.1 hypothetical protein [Mesorhizobium sp. BR1-1-16]